MLRFASALPALREAAQRDLRRRGLKRDRVAADVVRLIDLGLFRIGSESTPSWTITTAPRRSRSAMCG